MIFIKFLLYLFILILLYYSMFDEENRFQYFILIFLLSFLSLFYTHKRKDKGYIEQPDEIIIILFNMIGNNKNEHYSSEQILKEHRRKKKETPQANIQNLSDINRHIIIN